MKNRILVAIILSALVPGIIVVAVLIWPRQGLRRTSFAEHKLVVFKDAGFQMEIPTDTPFVSSSAASVLVMLHEIRHGLQAESGFLIEVQVLRKSKADMNVRDQFATQGQGDEIQSWRYRIYSRLDMKKTADRWYVRKDIETPDGQFLTVDGELTVSEFAETDLSEIRRMVESIKLIPK